MKGNTGVCSHIKWTWDGIENWLVVANILYAHPYLGKWSSNWDDPPSICAKWDWNIYLPDNSALVTFLGYLSDAFKGCWWPPIGESPGWRRKSKQTTCSVYPWICLFDARKKVTQESSDPASKRMHAKDAMRTHNRDRFGDACRVLLAYSPRAGVYVALESLKWAATQVNALRAASDTSPVVKASSAAALGRARSGTSGRPTINTSSLKFL